MALTSIEFDSFSVKASRGNIGTVVAVVFNLGAAANLKLVVPATTNVKSGIQYGQQGTELTGSFVGGTPDVAY